MVNALLIDNNISNATKQLLLSWGCNVLNVKTLIQATDRIIEKEFIPDGIVLNTPRQGYARRIAHLVYSEVFINR